MAEEELNTEEKKEEENLEPEEKKSSKKKLFIFIGGGVLILIIAILLFFFIFGGSDKKEEEPEKEEKQEEAVVVKIPEEEFFPGIVKLPEMKIKLIPEKEGEEKYLRLSFFVQFKEDNDKYLLIEKLDILQKQIIDKFQKRRASDLDGISEKILLKQELIKDIEKIAQSNNVANVIFSEFLILDW